MERLIIPAKIDYLDDVIGFVDRYLDATGCPEKTKLQIRLAMEEVFVNIVSYAYAPEDGEAEVLFELLEDPFSAKIQFIDSGKMFDPLAKEDSDTSEEAIMARAGGMGILLVKNVMDEVTYNYKDGKNILTLTKKL